MADEVSRRDFFSLCSVLAASLTACSNASNQLRVASSFVADPALEDYRPALRALVETVLPTDFPLDHATVESRLLRMFPLENERRFLGFQRTLIFFDQLDLAPHVAAPLLAAERVALDVPHRMSEREFRRVAAQKTAAESESCEAFFRRFGAASRFAPLAREARTAWLELWSASELTVKRDFASTVRSLIYISAYSADALWPAIGYDGPLIDRPERNT